MIIIEIEMAIMYLNFKNLIPFVLITFNNISQVDVCMCLQVTQMNTS